VTVAPVRLSKPHGSVLVVTTPFPLKHATATGAGLRSVLTVCAERMASLSTEMERERESLFCHKKTVLKK